MALDSKTNCEKSKSSSNGHNFPNHDPDGSLPYDRAKECSKSLEPAVENGVKTGSEKKHHEKNAKTLSKTSEARLKEDKIKEHRHKDDHGELKS